MKKSKQEDKKTPRSLSVDDDEAEGGSSDKENEGITNMRKNMI
jgi:hypothetical protein